MTPGAYHVGHRDNSGDDAPVVEVNHQLDLAVVAHLAPDDAAVEAEITQQLENEMNEILEEQLKPTLIDSENIIIVPEAKDTPISSWNRRRTWIMAISVFLVVGVVLVGVVFRLLKDDDTKKEIQTEGQVADLSSAPSETPPFVVESLGPLMAELRSSIAPTDDYLLPFMDPTSPQSQALAWLEDDPITLTPGRLTQTVLERYALAVLYYTTSGPSWNNYHLSDESVCTWNDKSGLSGVYCSDVCESNNETTSEDPVTCSSNVGTVDFLLLPENNLVGTIPWELVLLTGLVNINLDFNSLTGSIPARINELTSLHTFWAILNQLSGPLPPTFSPAAKNINVNDNLLTGSIPETWWTTMSELDDLRLFANLLTGTLSTAIGQLPNMTIFGVMLNLMTGSLPSELGQLSSIYAISLYSNSFSGSLNDTICLLSGLYLVEADCEEVECPCCTKCCIDEINACYEL